jgi:hypothetical protein
MTRLHVLQMYVIWRRIMPCQRSTLKRFSDSSSRQSSPAHFERFATGITSVTGLGLFWNNGLHILIRYPTSNEDLR